MVPLAVYLTLLAFSVIIIAGGMYLIFKNDSSGQVRNDRGNVEVEEEEVPRGNNRRRAMGRRGRFDEEDEEEENDLNTDQIPRVDAAGNKIGKKKAAKLAAKAQAKREREALQKLREEKKRIEEKEYQERQRIRAKEEELEKKLEEEERIRQEEIQRKKQEEYDAWKSFISVEEEGINALDEAGKQKRIDEIIHHIKEKKIVLLEDLATMFKMKTSEIVELLQKLDSEDKLIGVIDDRGKFIHIEQDELDQVAKFILRRGRVHVNEIHNECNKIIKLPENKLTDEQILSDEES